MCENPVCHVWCFRLAGQIDIVAKGIMHTSFHVHQLFVAVFLARHPPQFAIISSIRI